MRHRKTIHMDFFCMYGLTRIVLATERSKRGKCCMCTCIASLTAQVRLICSWCMKICLRRAAHISAERLISVQTDEQTEIDMETNMADNIGDKSVYILAFWPREDQSIKS
jgi:hypothetical protein